MDATKRPIKISPELVNYAERHKIFENMKKLFELLIIDRPTDPIKYLIEYLKKDIDDVPRIFIMGPPVSGKHTIAKMLSGRLQCQLLTQENVFSLCDNDIKVTAENCKSDNKPIPNNIWTRGLKSRTKMFDCEKKGWVLCGYPNTRDQVFDLQCEGIFPTHVLLLEAPDYVLVERAEGKLIDPITADIYHATFDPPIDSEIKDRLERPAGCSANEMVSRLSAYHREIALVKPLYEHVLQVVNADQPIADIFQIALDFTVKRARLPGLRTPRIVLLGPAGSGKSTVASLICKKYNIIKIHCGELIREAIADENKHGLAMRSFVDKKLPVPDFILVQLIEEKLTSLCCSTNGWLLYGYPLTVKQAENLDCVKLEPNRVFFLEVPSFISLERLCERRLDPVTGEQFHLSYNPAHEPTSQHRIVQHPKDDVRVIKQKLAQYNANLADLKEYYKEHVAIDANQELHNVFELIESYLVNPLPMNLK